MFQVCYSIAFLRWQDLNSSRFFIGMGLNVRGLFALLPTTIETTAAIEATETTAAIAARSNRNNSRNSNPSHLNFFLTTYLIVYEWLHYLFKYFVT